VGVRRQIQEEAIIMQDKEVKEFLESFGDHWAVVGEYEELVNIVDNDVFKKFEALSWIIEDDKVYEATKTFLLKQNLTRFNNDQELNDYLEILTKEKYGQE
jgi:hypothetical protein